MWQHKRSETIYNTVIHLDSEAILFMGMSLLVCISFEIRLNVAKDIRS